MRSLTAFLFLSTASMLVAAGCSTAARERAEGSSDAGARTDPRGPSDAGDATAGASAADFDPTSWQLADTATLPEGMWGEALQKSLYFYDAEKSGPGITGGRLEWRGDSEVGDGRIALVPKQADGSGTSLSQEFIEAHRAVLDPDGDGTVDLHGGFHDAGDHVKFGLPQGYAASTLGWALYEFRDAFVKSGQERHMVEILRWFSDYFLRSTFRAPSGEVIAFAYQVGEGGIDHTYWGPPELQRPEVLPRPAYFATAETPASDQAGEASAALALMAIHSKDVDPQYAERCLDTARALYAFAAKHRGLGYSGGFYGSSYDDDELSWAAIWLNIATGEQHYLEDIVAIASDGQYTGYLKRIMGSVQDDWQNIWVHSWDVVWGGVFLKLAALTDEAKFWTIARWNLEYWSGIAHQDPSDTNFLTPTPAGYRVVNTWGSARYNTAAQMCALVFRKETGREDFARWAKGQMEYLMGANPLKRSYIVGFKGLGDDWARHPHHRAAHGSKTNSMLDPPEHRHTLWGALVGGPDANDQHNDVTTDYVSNEVAIDYNATLVGALAGLYTYYGQGQGPLAAFPPREPETEPYFAEAKIEQENGERTQVTLTLHNESMHPPHFEYGLSARYYFDIRELLAAGQDISDASLEVMYDEQKTGYGAATKLTGPVPVDAAKGVYYVEFGWAGYPIYGKRDLHFALIARQDSQWKAHWDPSNDWSHQGLTTSAALNDQIPVYRDGVRIFGREPEGP